MTTPTPKESGWREALEERVWQAYNDRSATKFDDALTELMERVEATHQAAIEEVRKFGLRWYDENYKHESHKDGSTTAITEKDFDSFLKALTTLKANK